jgi:hypothetical protein
MLPHLFGGQQPARHLGADHVNVRLALAINAAAEAMRTQLVVGHLARESFAAAWDRKSSMSSRTTLSYSCSRSCCSVKYASFSIEITILAL